MSKLVSHLAGSCFPNCHPTGGGDAFANHGSNLALGLAVVGIIVLVVMVARGK